MWDRPVICVNRKINIGGSMTSIERAIRLTPEALAVYNAAVARVVQESQRIKLSPGYISYMPRAALRDYIQRETVRRNNNMKFLLPEKPWHQL
jgi:hypothetical protein